VTPKPTGNFPAFPESAYLGVAAKFADLYAQHYESPKEFLYIDFLGLLGTILSGRFRVDFGELTTQPRLYVLKIAQSAWRRKSASTTFARKFVQGAVYLAQRRLAGNVFQIIAAGPSTSWIRIIPGAGSADGLANAFGHFLDQGDSDGQQNKPPKFVGDARIVLVYDEFRRFEKKAKGEGSVLISMVNEMFDNNEYSNVTKLSSVEIIDGHLGFLSNTTENTFRSLVDAPEMVDIGFLNRFFFVGSNTRVRKARPTTPAESVLKPIREELADLLAELPALDKYGVAQDETVIQLTPEADDMWARWYEELPETETTARLDALGMRLMGLFAFVAHKRLVDVEIMAAVLDVLEYQRQLREVYRPAQGRNSLAQMEEKIVQQLKRHGALTRRELRQYTNAGREGIKVFDEAINNLKNTESEITVLTMKDGAKATLKFALRDGDAKDATEAA
jgi:Protein of unknown function (DUF3987)